ncbi:MAG: hypothetical protein IJS45_00660 [Clostridia bacterium]|nr:hypothetical protein [Clostridia bacterium]
MNSEKEKNNKERLSRSQKINIKVDNEREQNPYYLKVARRYRVVKLVSVLLLLAFVVGMIILYRDQITYENLVYLAKDLDTDIDAEGAAFSEIKYDESRKMSAAIFKGKLAIATTTSLTLYNNTGSAERSFKISMENPKVLTGDKYVMVYDVGGTTYSICTSLVEAQSKQTDYALQGAALSKSGSFALLNRARENRYVISIFDENFRELSRIYKDKYVMDVALSDDGTRYAVASCDIGTTDFTTEVMFGICGSENAKSFTIDDAMPLNVFFFGDGSFCVVCDSSVHFYAANGEETANYPLIGYGVSGVSFSDDRVLLVCSANAVDSASKATVFKSDGTEEMTFGGDKKINYCAIGEAGVFYASDGVLTKVLFDGTEKQTECPVFISGLVPFSDNVLVLGKTSAVTGFAEETSAPEETDG